MLGGREALFRSIKSIAAVCYRASEATEPTLQRLLRELPEAGVSLIELDAYAQASGCNSENKCDDLDIKLRRALKEAVTEPSATLLLAGSAQTLALAEGTPMATVGYGALAAGQETAQTRKKADILVEGFEETDVLFFDRIMKRAQGLPWVTVVTRRCILREISLDDLDALFALYAQPGITDYTEPLYERAGEEQYTRDYIRNMYYFYGYGMWLVFDRANGALIGRAGFSHQAVGDEVVLELGYIIGVPYQRKGYATEICKKLIEYARMHLSSFGTLNCFVERGNTASLGLLRKLGFEECGTAKIKNAEMLRYRILL